MISLSDSSGIELGGLSLCGGITVFVGFIYGSTDFSKSAYEFKVVDP